MTKIDEEAVNRLQATIDEVRRDARTHPDPCGSGLLSLLQAIQQHAEEEASTIQTYARIGRETSDPVVAFVMQFLVDDEQRHHALFARMASSLHDRFNWAPDSTAQPFDSAGRAQGDAETARQVRALADEERRGAQALCDLASRQDPGDADLVCLLLEAMAMDSDKHAHLLTFVASRLSSSGV